MDLSPDRLDRVLMNPKRFMIATILYLRGPTTMGDLQKVLGISWGDLDTHLRRMREEGYVGVKRSITRLGPRTVVYLTRLGVDRYRSLIEVLDSLIKNAKG